MATAVGERVKPKTISESKFCNPDEMTIEELTDPDYRLKQLMKQFGGDKKGEVAICSQCHHCR